MIQQLYARLSLSLTSNQLLCIRLGLVGLALLAAVAAPHAAWACDLGSGGCGGR